MEFKKILYQHKFRFSFTLVLILTEALIGILLPLFIGFAVDGVIKNDLYPVYQLGGLGIAIVVIGGLRRLVDSRFYGKLYLQISSKLMKNNTQEISIKTARLNMLNEITEFMENQTPELIQHIIALTGVTLIILSLNTKIFIYALFAGLFVILIYWLSSKKITQYNRDYNDEMETQVNNLNKSWEDGLKLHIKRLVKTNIKLSDLETINFSLSWVAMSFFLVLVIIVSSSEGIIEYGALFALIMYVYQYIESVVSLPLFYQQWLRLKEIYARINTF